MQTACTGGGAAGGARKVLSVGAKVQGQHIALRGNDCLLWKDVRLSDDDMVF